MPSHSAHLLIHSLHWPKLQYIRHKKN